MCSTGIIIWSHTRSSDLEIMYQSNNILFNKTFIYFGSFESIDMKDCRIREKRKIDYKDPV